MDVFPYPPREGQTELVAHLRAAVVRGGDAVVESPTGTGKTVCTLAAAIPEAKRRGKRIVYMVRTNSQERQVMLEYRAMRGMDPSIGPAVALQGRAHMCPRTREDAAFAEATPEELGRMCRASCRAADRVASGGAAPPDSGPSPGSAGSATGDPTRTTGPSSGVAPCRFYQGLTPERLVSLASRLEAEVLTAEELADAAAGEGACPYLVARDVLPRAFLIVCPYIYLLHPGLRHTFLRSIEARVEDLVVIVDEAHNVPDFARELASAELSLVTLERAAAEAREHGDPEVGEGVRLTALIDVLERIVLDTARTQLPAEAAAERADRDALLGSEAFKTEILTALQWSTVRLARAIDAIEAFAEGVRKRRLQAGRVPRSYAASVGRFLDLASAAGESDAYAHLIERNDAGEPRMAVRALDPSLVTDILTRTHASLHVSGTLRPLLEYRDSIGLPPDTTVRSFPSPFAAANRRVLCDPSVTTRFAEVHKDPGMWGRIRARVAAVRNGTDRNVVMFAASRDVMMRVVDGLGPDAIVDRPGIRQAELMDGIARFRSSHGGSLASVMGGRIAEGLDFPGSELEVVILVGLPYPPPSAHLTALERFYERRFGRGWEYAVEAPMMRRVLQALGRLIRSPADRGVAVILDRRATVLARDIPDMVVTDHIEAEILHFFKGDPSSSGAMGTDPARQRFL